MADVSAALDDAAAAIAAAGSMVVIGHVGPDGDALGSAIALAHSARQQGKTAYVTFGEPFVVADQLQFLDLAALAPPRQLVGQAFDVAVAVDTASEDRLGEAAAVAEAAGALVVVDHHVSNDGFGDIVVVDPDAAATAELVFDLLGVLDWPLDVAAAEALYVGLVSDTGRFQYSNTSAKTHRIAAQLLELGVESDRVGRHLFEEAPFGYLQVAGAVSARTVLDPEARLVWSVLTMDDLNDAGIGYEQTEGLIDLVRLAREAEVAMLLKELGDGRLKGSLRSRGAIDVGAIAAGFGGGGHHNAAGFTVQGTVEQVVESVSSGLR